MATIKPLGDPLTREEMRAIVNTATNDAVLNVKNLRNAILIRILAWTGRRIGEILSLKVKNVNFEEALITTIIEKKKNDLYERPVSIGNTTTKMIKTYVKAKRLSPNSKLFNITKRQALRIIKKYATKVGIKNKRITAHSFRHSLITFLKQEGRSNEEVAKVTGQAPVTVARYDHTTYFDFEKEHKSIISKIIGDDDGI